MYRLHTKRVIDRQEDEEIIGQRPATSGRIDYAGSLQSLLPSSPALGTHPTSVVFSPVNRHIKCGSMAKNLPVCCYAHPRFPAGRFFRCGEPFRRLTPGKFLTCRIRWPSYPSAHHFCSPPALALSSSPAFLYIWHKLQERSYRLGSPPPTLASPPAFASPHRPSSDALITPPHFTQPPPPKNSIPNIALLSAGASSLDQLRHHPTRHPSHPTILHMLLFFMESGFENRFLHGLCRHRAEGWVEAICFERWDWRWTTANCRGLP